MIRPAQLRDDIIVPVLTLLAGVTEPPPGGQENAVELLLGTAMQESHCGDYLAQVHGPALGVWQMEPATEVDIWNTFLAFRNPLRAAVRNLVVPAMPRTAQLAGNLYYACAMARVKYMRTKDPMPAAGDLPAQAAFYVKVYNAGGKATVEEYLGNYRLLQGALVGG